MSMRVILATARRNMIIYLRAYPWSFFISHILGAANTVFLGYFMYRVLFGGQVGETFIDITGSADYLTYLVLGAGIYLFVSRTWLSVSRMFITELREGTLHSLLLAPMDRLSYLLGGMLQQLATTGLEFALVLLMGWPLGIDFSRTNWPALGLAVFLSLAAYFGLAIVLGALMLYTRDTYISQNTLFAAVYLVCGVIFPIEYLPIPLQALGRLLPVTPSLEVIRGSVMLGRGVAEQAAAFATLAAMALVYLAVGMVALRRSEKTALEEALA